MAGPRWRSKALLGTTLGKGRPSISRRLEGHSEPARFNRTHVRTATPNDVNVNIPSHARFEHTFEYSLEIETFQDVNAHTIETLQRNALCAVLSLSTLRPRQRHLGVLLGR